MHGDTSCNAGSATALSAGGQASSEREGAQGDGGLQVSQVCRQSAIHGGTRRGIRGAAQCVVEPALVRTVNLNEDVNPNN